MSSTLQILLKEERTQELVQLSEHALANGKPLTGNKFPGHLQKHFFLAFASLNHVYSGKNTSSIRLALKTAYTLLYAVEIEEAPVQEAFHKVMGIDQVQDAALYHFYCSSLELLIDYTAPGAQTAEARRVGLYGKFKLAELKNPVHISWRGRVIDTVLVVSTWLTGEPSFMVNAEEVLSIISELKAAQQTSEKAYFDSLPLEQQPFAAIELFGLYHLIQSIEVFCKEYRGPFSKNDLDAKVDKLLLKSKDLLSSTPRLGSIADIILNNLNLLLSNKSAFPIDVRSNTEFALTIAASTRIWILCSIR